VLHALASSALCVACCVLREASTVCCVLRAAPQGSAAGAAPIKRDRRQVARGSATRGKYEARSTSMRCALDVYRLREGARLLAERCARSPGSARVCAREMRTSKDVINLAPQQKYFVLDGPTKALSGWGQGSPPATANYRFRSRSAGAATTGAGVGISRSAQSREKAQQGRSCSTASGRFGRFGFAQQPTPSSSS